MGQSKIDYRELDQMLRAGKPYSKIAKHFGVSKGRISQAKKEMRNNINKVTVMEKAYILEFYPRRAVILFHPPLTMTVDRLISLKCKTEAQYLFFR